MVADMEKLPQTGSHLTDFKLANMEAAVSLTLSTYLRHPIDHFLQYAITPYLSILVPSLFRRRRRFSQMRAHDINMVRGW
jgi:hypothetical protein